MPYFDCRRAPQPPTPTPANPQNNAAAAGTAPHLVTLLRRIGLGFTPQPRDKIGTNEEREIEDLNVGPIRASMLDLDILSTPHRNTTPRLPHPSPRLTASPHT